MKKANHQNLLIIIIIYGLFYIVHLALRQNNIDIYFDINLTTPIKIGILILAFILLMITSVLNASYKVFDRYIKHERKTKLSSSRYMLLLSSAIISYLFLLFEVEYYYYFSSIIILYLIYFSSLIIYDSYFVKSQQAPVVKVNDEIVTKFLELLGGRENILSVSYEYSRLKVELKDIKQLNLEEFKNLGAKGAFIAGNKLQAVIGSNASELELAIKTFLSHSN